MPKITPITEPELSSLTKVDLQESHNKLLPQDNTNSANIDCIDCDSCHNCRDCYDGNFCNDCINCKSCNNCNQCTNCYQCDSCYKCTNCILCKNLANKITGYWVLNNEVTEEEFNAALAKLTSA